MLGALASDANGMWSLPVVDMDTSFTGSLEGRVEAPSDSGVTRFMPPLVLSVDACPGNISCDELHIDDVIVVARGSLRK